MDIVKYVLDYFFNWGANTGAFWHFILLAFLCWLLGSPTRVSIDNSVRENGTESGTQSEGKAS